MRSAKTSKRLSRKQLGGASHKRRSTKGKGKKSGSKGKKGKKSGSKGKKGKMADDMARCMKCKCGVKPVNSQKKTLPNGRCALTGTCPDCGTKVFKFCKC
jgi:hypothetical protein